MTSAETAKKAQEAALEAMVAPRTAQATRQATSGRRTRASLIPIAVAATAGVLKKGAGLTRKSNQGTTTAKTRRPNKPTQDTDFMKKLSSLMEQVRIGHAAPRYMGLATSIEDVELRPASRRACSLRADIPVFVRR